MKVTKEETAAREQFLLEVFQSDPDLSIPRANARLAEVFGSRLNLNRAYRLRALARRVLESVDEPRSPSTTLTGSPAELRAAMRVVRQIARSGVANLRTAEGRGFLTVRRD